MSHGKDALYHGWRKWRELSENAILSRDAALNLFNDRRFSYSGAEWGATSRRHKSFGLSWAQLHNYGDFITNAQLDERGLE